MVNLTTADISDSAGAQYILDAIRKRWPWLKHFFADGAYDRGKLMDKAAFLDFTVEVIKRITGEPGFKVLPRRWAELPKVPRAQHVERQWRAWNAPLDGWSAGAASCAITSDASTSRKA